MCIFCKIINKEIPAHTVYEDQEVIAFLDLSQANNGHTLVVPKKHFDNIFDIDFDIYHKVLDTVKKLSPAIIKATNSTGVNIINNSGIDAGQTVNHFHIHIIPRYANDGIKIEARDRSNVLDLDDYIKIKEKIIKSI